MTIKIEQKCNKCNRKRELKLNSGGDAITLSSASLQGGWRKIDDKDVCNICISDFLENL